MITTKIFHITANTTMRIIVNMANSGITHIMINFVIIMFITKTININIPVIVANISLCNIFITKLTNVITNISINITNRVTTNITNA